MIFNTHLLNYVPVSVGLLTIEVAGGYTVVWQQKSKLRSQARYMPIIYITLVIGGGGCWLIAIWRVCSSRPRGGGCEWPLGRVGIGLVARGPRVRSVTGGVCGLVKVKVIELIWSETEKAKIYPM